MPTAQAGAARAEIEAAETDNLSWPPPEEIRETETIAPSWSPYWVAAFLVVVFVVGGPYDAGSIALRAAAADSQRILAGEPWRLVTALTVHADPKHLAANAAALIFLGHAVCRLLGGGWGWAVILAAGIMGNGAVALTARLPHVSVGASTACFGALGALSALAAWRRRGRYGSVRSVWNPTWLPFGAGMGLLAMMGTGPESDLAAHLYGFLAGAVLAVPAGACEIRRASPPFQCAIQAVCLAVVMTAWRLALMTSG